MAVVGGGVLDDCDRIPLPSVKGDPGDEACADGGEGKAFDVTLGR